MAEKKKSPAKKTSSKKIGSKAIAKGAPSALSRADTIQMPDGKDLVPHRVMQVTGKVENSSYSSPLPSPEDFAKYNEGTPNAAERILSMEERRQRERSALNLLITKFVFIAVIGLLIAFVTTALYASNPYAIPSGVAGISFVVGIWLYRFKNGKKG